jgi:replication-associated recombination protein RarA
LRDRAQIERRLQGAKGGVEISAKETGSLMPPANILNAPTKLMKDIGYGKGYAYDHDARGRLFRVRITGPMRLRHKRSINRSSAASNDK